MTDESVLRYHQKASKGHASSWSLYTPYYQVFGMFLNIILVTFFALFAYHFIGSSGGGRLLRMEWSLQCNDQFPEKNQVGGQ